MYKTPVTTSDEVPQCNVTFNSQRAELLTAASVHIWDEFPMSHRKNFEAVSHCLCDLTQCNIPCGGRMFVGCGDFRQIPPVIPGGGQSDIIMASIKNLVITIMARIQSGTCLIPSVMPETRSTHNSSTRSKMASCQPHT